jgi:RNA polymerase sigma factor (sigma-70 family)
VTQPALSRIVQTLRLSARPKGGSAESDHELLVRFVQSQDADAFRELVHRHERTVLAACRQVLSEPADIDDAFQATFLALLKKAKSLDASAPLAGWLFAVAHRVSVRARSDTRRRSTREAEAATRKPATVELPDLSWREAVAVLHDELNALPEKYRLPLLLCCVQGVTRDEAAEQLRTTVGAIRGQLERGRSLLEKRLTRRGITLSVGWLAVLVGSSRAAEVPPAELIELTLRAAGGTTSPAAAALARGAFSMTMLKRAGLAALLFLGLLGLGFGVAKQHPTAKTRDSQTRAKESPTAAKAEAPSTKTPQRAITGKVLGADGRPIVADLMLMWLDGKTESLGKTKPDGTFAVTVPLKSPGAYLLARAAGHGVEFMMPAANTLSEVTFKLPRDNPIRGRVIDTQGRPVAGARVAVSSLTVYEKHPADRYLNQWTKEGRARGVPLPNGDRSLSAQEHLAVRRHSESPFVVKTDKDGKFQIAGVGAERLVGLTISGAGIADTRIGVMNRAGFDAKPFNEDQNDRRRMPYSFVKHARRLFGPEPALVAEQEKIIRGLVTDHLGHPRAGVRVVFSRPNRRDLNPDYNAATTGKDGRYEIRGARKHKGYMVECYADPKVGLLPCQAFADDTVGYEPVTIDLKCAKGVVVTGTVKNKATGAPVGASVHVVVLANNPFVKDYPPFMNSASFNSGQNHTGKDGRYRIVTIPGPVLLMAGPSTSDFRQVYKPVKADPKYPEYFHRRLGSLGYYGVDSSFGIVHGCWCKVIDSKKGDAEVNVDIELEPAASMTVRVVDAAGKPVKGAHATGVTHIDFEHAHPRADTDTLRLYNVEPGKERLVAVAHAKRKLVGTLRVKAADKDPVVKLGPGGVLTGRVVGADGKPIAGVTVALHYARREVGEVSHVLDGEEERIGMNQSRQVVTAVSGEFRFDHLFPGYEFRLLFHKGKKQYGPEYGKAPRYTVAKHGEERKLGDVTVTPRDATEE